MQNLGSHPRSTKSESMFLQDSDLDACESLRSTELVPMKPPVATWSEGMLGLGLLF